MNTDEQSISYRRKMFERIIGHLLTSVSSCQLAESDYVVLECALRLLLKPPSSDA